MKNFWFELRNKNKSILALAPLAGITDSPFRQICKDFGADVVYSEMASATALFYAPKNLKNNPTLDLIKYTTKEKPYVVQLFGSDPEHFVFAAKLLSNKKNNFKLPQGLDINFGCPVKKVVKQGAGAALAQNLKLSRAVIKAVLDNTNLPVSIKIRSGYGKIDCLKFLDNIRDLPISALMIHGRTLKQGFSGPIDTKIIKKSRNYFGEIILANGGIYTREDVIRILKETGADGIGIGQGALGKPWIFSEIKNKKLEIKSNKDIFTIALKHAKLMKKYKGEPGILEMRKHLCWYVQGLPGAKRMREELVKVNTLEEIKKIFKKNSA